MHFKCIQTASVLIVCLISAGYECGVLTPGGKPHHNYDNDNYDNQPVLDDSGNLFKSISSPNEGAMVASDTRHVGHRSLISEPNHDSNINGDVLKSSDHQDVDPDYPSSEDNVKESQLPNQFTDHRWSSFSPKMHVNIASSSSSSSSSSTPSSYKPSSSSSSSIILSALIPSPSTETLDSSSPPKAPAMQPSPTSSSQPSEFISAPPPANSIHHEENKSIDYATSLIKELLKSTWSFEWPFKDSNAESTDEKSKLFPPSSLPSSEVEPQKPLSDDEVSGPPFDGEEELLGEVEKLIGYIRESEATEESGKDYDQDEQGEDLGEDNVHKSRNNRNRLTHQMDYVEQLLNEYRSKQGVINLRHWARGVSTPRLSVTSPIAVLRDALMEEIRRKRIKEQQERIKENQKILEEIG